MNHYLVAALYHFVSLPDHADMQEPLLALCLAHDVTGTLLLAHEGINGTIAGPAAGIHAVLDHLRADARLAALEHKESWSEQRPFHRMKVKLKREIVTMGVTDIDPLTMAGQYVEAEDWNALIAQPDVVVVDVRNDYEVAIGTFASAVNPETARFADFPEWVRVQSQPGGVLANAPRVAMFCTGGIRCEKSTAYLKSQGFDQVYHLRGGILKYLETVAPEDSMWQGECFVFDERVAVGHGLQRGEYSLCRSCRMPLGREDRRSPLFEAGVSCHHCHEDLDDERRARLRERQRQVALARQRHEQHIGVATEIQKERAQARRQALRERAQQRREQRLAARRRASAGAP